MKTGRVAFACAVVAVAALTLQRVQRPAAAQNQAPTVRPWTVTASRYTFDPPRIEVSQDDLVEIDLRTDDIAHSLTIDAYRIAKRVEPGPIGRLRVPRGPRRASSPTTATCRSTTAAAGCAESSSSSRGGERSDSFK